MRVIHYINWYSDAELLVAEASKMYKLIQQDFEHEIYLVSIKGVLQYKVVIKLLRDAGL